MDKFQSFALSVFLSDFPDDMSYDDIMDLMASDTWSVEEISVWHPFENHPLNQVAKFIDDLAKHAKYHFGANHG